MCTVPNGELFINPLPSTSGFIYSTNVDLRKGIKTPVNSLSLQCKDRGGEGVREVSVVKIGTHSKKTMKMA